MHKQHLLGYLRNAEGSGGGGGGAPPPAAPTAPVVDESKIVAAVLAALDARTASKAPPLTPPTPAASPAKDPTDPEAMRGRIAQLERTLEEQRKAAEQAQTQALERDRISQIRQTLSTHTFASDAAAADALGVFSAELQFDQAGNLVGRDGRSARDYIDATLRERRSYLLKPVDAGGAGARNSQGAPKTVDIESIRPGMSAEDRAAVLATIKTLQGN